MAESPLPGLPAIGRVLAGGVVASWILAFLIGLVAGMHVRDRAVRTTQSQLGHRLTALEAVAQDLHHADSLLCRDPAAHLPTETP